MDNPAIDTASETVYLNASETQFIVYAVWKRNDVAAGVDKRKTFCYLGGINDFAGKFAEHADIFLDVRHPFYPPPPSALVC